jgi:hypothetical protein
LTLSWVRKTISPRPKQVLVKMYEDIPLTISEMISSWKNRILECPVMDYSNNSSFIQAQPNSVKVINDILKFCQDCLNISLDFKQTYIGRRVDEQSLIKIFFYVMPTGIIKKISVEQRWQVLWHIKKIPTTTKKILSTQTLS